MNNKNIILCDNCNCYGHPKPMELNNKCPQFNYGFKDTWGYHGIIFNRLEDKVFDGFVGFDGPISLHIPDSVEQKHGYLNTFRNEVSWAYHRSKLLGFPFKNKEEYLEEKLFEYWLFVNWLNYGNFNIIDQLSHIEKQTYMLTYKRVYMSIEDPVDVWNIQDWSFEKTQKHKCLQYMMNPFLKFNLNCQGVFRNQNIIPVQLVLPDLPEFRDLHWMVTTECMFGILTEKINQYKVQLSQFHWINPITGDVWDYRTEIAAVYPKDIKYPLDELKNTLVYAKDSEVPVDEIDKLINKSRQIINSLPTNYSLMFRDMWLKYMWASPWFDLLGIGNLILNLPRATQHLGFLRYANKKTYRVNI